MTAWMVMWTSLRDRHGRVARLSRRRVDAGRCDRERRGDVLERLDDVLPDRPAWTN